MKIKISISEALTLTLVQSEIGKKNKMDAATRQVHGLTHSMKGADKAKREAAKNRIKAIKDNIARIKASRKTKLSLGQLVAKRDALRKKK